MYYVAYTIWLLSIVSLVTQIRHIHNTLSVCSVVHKSGKLAILGINNKFLYLDMSSCISLGHCAVLHLCVSIVIYHVWLISTCTCKWLHLSR